MSKDQNWQQFQTALEEHHEFPCHFTFKFVVPKAKETELEQVLPEGELSKRSSSNGNYISFTLVKFVATSQEVLDIYQKAALIEGILTL